MKEAGEVIHVDTNAGPLKSIESYAPLTLKNQNGQWLCGSLKSDGQTICISPFVMDNGRCRMHGGPSRVKTGVYRNRRSKDIRKRIAELKSDPELLNLRGYVAATVALLEEALDNLETVDLDSLEKAKAVGMISTSLARIIETQHKIQVGYYYSPEKIQEIQGLLAACIQKQCHDCPKLPALAANIQSIPMPD